MSFTREDLERSEKTVGQIYPVLIDKNGKIIDGFHRKRVYTACEPCAYTANPCLRFGIRFWERLINLNGY